MSEQNLNHLPGSDLPDQQTSDEPTKTCKGGSQNASQKGRKIWERKGRVTRAMTKAKQEYIALRTLQQKDAAMDSNMPQAAEFVYESINTDDQVQFASKNDRMAGSLVAPSRKRLASGTVDEPDAKRGRRFDANADSSGGPHPTQSAEARLGKTGSLNDEGPPKDVISQATLHIVGSNAAQELYEEESTQEFTDKDLAARTRDCLDSGLDFVW